MTITDPQRPNPPALSPGAPVTVFRQTETILAALTVDAAGQMTVTWLDLTLPVPNQWKGPVAFGSPILPPGSGLSEVLRQR